MRTLQCQFFRILSTLSSCKSCRNARSICTHQAHHNCMIKIIIFDNLCAWCVSMCVYNVPDVCTYFMVRATSKSNISAFRERVPIVSTTKTRLCNCIYIFDHFSGIWSTFRKQNTPLLTPQISEAECMILCIGKNTDRSLTFGHSRPCKSKK